MAFDYSAPENDVRTRLGLSSPIRKTLLESERAGWPAHPRFGGKAAFFLDIHHALLNGSAQLVNGLQVLTEEPPSTLNEALAVSGARQLSGNLIGYAHHHHHMEDVHYFPAFARILPQLDHALALLDGDHRALEEALDGTEKSMAALQAGANDRDSISRALDHASTLEKVIGRHLYDEEDIIIPIFLIAM